MKVSLREDNLAFYFDNLSIKRYATMIESYLQICKLGHRAPSVVGRMIVDQKGRHDFQRSDRDLMGDKEPNHTMCC